MTAICFVCNLPIMSHQVGLVWSGGNGWDDLMREQVKSGDYSWLDCWMLNLLQFSSFLGVRIDDSPATGRSTRLRCSEFTSEHIAATHQPQSATKLARPVDWHSPRVEWDGPEAQPEAATQPTRDTRRSSSQLAMASYQQWSIHQHIAARPCTPAAKAPRVECWLRY